MSFFTAIFWKAKSARVCVTLLFLMHTIEQLNIVYAFELNLEGFYNLHPVLPVRHLHDAFCIEEVLALSNQYDQDYEDAGLT